MSEKKLKVVMFWSSIITEAKKCGQLRMEGKHEEADALQEALEENVRKADEVVLDISLEL